MEVIMKKIISKNINELLEKRGWSKYRLEQVMGIDHDCIHRWCRGENSPSAESLWKLACVFEVPVDRFYKGAEKWVSTFW